MELTELEREILKYFMAMRKMYNEEGIGMTDHLLYFSNDTIRAAYASLVAKLETRMGVPNSGFYSDIFLKFGESIGVKLSPDDTMDKCLIRARELAKCKFHF